METYWIAAAAVDEPKLRLPVRKVKAKAKPLMGRSVAAAAEPQEPWDGGDVDDRPWERMETEVGHHRRHCRQYSIGADWASLSGGDCYVNWCWA